MKDEIKEILGKWKCYIELTKKFTTNEYEMLRVEDIDKILDYITNLQEENKELGRYYTRANNEFLELNSRINKAIKYINTHYLNANEPELLNILQEEDKE